MARKAAGRVGGPRQNDERHFWEALSAEGRARTLGIIMTLARSPLIPVGAMGDPVPVGIVANIARPEGNITGVSSVAGPEIWGKRLQVLREAARRHRRWDSSVRIRYGASRR